MQRVFKKYWIFGLFLLFKIFEWKFNQTIQQEIKINSSNVKIPAPKFPQ